MTDTNREKNNHDKINSNTNSVYDYLKKTPSIFIAFVSIIVAIVTFFAKIVTLISARKELAFWEFDPSYATFGDDSLVYAVIISILFSFFTTLSAMWFSSICEAYLKQKRFYLTVRYYKKSKRQKIKTIKKNIKIGKSNDSEKEHLQDYIKMCDAAKAVKIDSWKDFFINFLPLLVLSFVSSTLLSIVSITKNSSDFWSIALSCLIVHLIMLWLLKITIQKSIIRKRELEENCIKLQFIEKQKEACDSSKYTLNNLFFNGIRSVLKNSTIISVVLMILANCIILCISNSLTETDPTKQLETFQLVTIEKEQYAIVYQNGSQYFLEEAVVQKNHETNNQNILKIYTNKQRIINTDDISITIYDIDKIIREHK